MSTTTARIKALDLFAGTGWGVACRRLGIKEMGVEIMDAAVATREANGMETVYRDVWDGLTLTAEQHRQAYGSYGLLIASPPCQTFSLAGNGAGRAAMDEVLEAIDVHAYKDPQALRDFGDKHDPRTALVLAPLAYVWRDRPRLVAMEQVPTVLPVWEACAEVMRSWGYEVKVEVLNAEQYGVPQTRRRAILVARRGGAVHLPAPTHSRYYAKDPGRLDEGVLPWISMAEALGWGMTDRPMPTITGGVHGPTDRWASGGNSVRKMIDAKVGGPDWINPEVLPESDGRTQYGMRLDVAEVSLLQSYPPFPSAVFRNGNQAHAAKRSLDQPAPTLHFGQRSNKVEWMDPALADDPAASGERVTIEQAAALQSYPPYEVPVFQGGHRPNAARRPVTDPAPTIIAGHDVMNRGFMDDSPRGCRTATVEEVAAFQSYPPEPAFIWTGTKSQKFLQVGNAVPPLLGEAVLGALIGVRPGR